MTQENTNDFYYTHDLNCVAALVCTGHTLKDIDRRQGERVMFVIERDDRIDEAINGYWNNSLQVTAQIYANTIKSIKNQVHSM